MSSQQACFLTYYNRPVDHRAGTIIYPTALCICGTEFMAFDDSDMRNKLSDHFSVEDFSDPMNLYKEPS